MRIWPSSPKFPKNHQMLEAVGMPYVVGIVFEELGAERPSEGQPIKCKSCGGTLCDPAAIRDVPGVGPAWTCEFCGSLVQVGTGASAGTDYRLPGAQKHGLGPAVVAAIDVSGSMAQGSLEAVKASLLNTLADLSVNAPETAFALVAFESGVHLYDASGRLRSSLKESSVLASEDAVRDWALKSGIALEPIRDVHHAARTAIESLEPLGSTALGPGVVAATALIEGRGGEGRLVLLTDGQANEGVGSLSGPSTRGKSFYASIAERLEEKGIVVDVVAVAGAGTLEVKTLAAMPELTGGELFYVDRSEVGGAFQSLGDVRYVARHAKLRFVLPRGVVAHAVSGLTPGTTTDGGLEFPLGSIPVGREVFLAISPSVDLEADRVPVQVQLRYSVEGSEQLSVRQAFLPVATSAAEIEADYDPGPATMMEVQRGGEDAYLYDFEKAKKRLLAIKERLGSMKERPRAAPYLAKLDDELKLIDEELAKKRSDSYYDSSTYASYSMQKRRSGSGPPTRKTR